MVLVPAVTHEVEVDPGRGVVTKRFRSWDRGEAEREWAALTLLADCAPGLSAEPVRADLIGRPPVIEMSRLPGAPLGGAALSAVQADGLALALERLWHAAPAAKVTRRAGSALNPVALTAQVRSMLAAPGDRVASGPARQALRASAAWLASGALDDRGGASVVFGHGDPNLANFLWDGTRVRIVDFEDSGPSYRAFELALLVEHISAWSESGLDAAAFLGLFDLTTAELAALRQFRRLAATYWLIKLQSAHQARPGTPDAVNRQAERLLRLLS
jgi:hypothetical protein